MTTEQMDFEPAWTEAHYLKLVLDMQNIHLFLTVLSNLGIKGKEANGLKADYWMVMAQNSERDEYIEDAAEERRTATDIRKLGDTEMGSLSWEEVSALGIQKAS